MRCFEPQQAVAEAPTRLHQRQPGVFVAGSALVQTTLVLECHHGLMGGITELAEVVTARPQPSHAKPPLEITNRFAAFASPQWKGVTQGAVARNSSSSWSKAPLLFAPTSRLATSPLENTSNVGMLITL